jgi:hypothetical protein
MARTTRTKWALTLVALLLLWLQGCSLSGDPLPPRPRNVAADAVRIPGGKTQWWIKCEYKHNVNTCQVFNAGGAVLHDEVFLPDDGGAAVVESELRIDPTRSNSARVWLENGRVLLPSTDFARHKEFLDDLRRR